MHTDTVPGQIARLAEKVGAGRQQRNEAGAVEKRRDASVYFGLRSGFSGAGCWARHTGQLPTSAIPRRPPRQPQSSSAPLEDGPENAQGRLDALACYTSRAILVQACLIYGSSIAGPRNGSIIFPLSTSLADKSSAHAMRKRRLDRVRLSLTFGLENSHLPGRRAPNATASIMRGASPPHQCQQGS